MALASSIGLHSAFLQVVAWTGMVVSYAQDASLGEAVLKTFDGKHPCCICKAIAAGKRSERKSWFTTQMQKLEFPLAGENSILYTRPRPRFWHEADSLAESLSLRPPTPPPRFIFA
jgi:hypothetical protein